MAFAAKTDNKDPKSPDVMVNLQEQSHIINSKVYLVQIYFRPCSKSTELKYPFLTTRFGLKDTHHPTMTPL